jgi:hypothetical protein
MENRAVTTPVGVSAAETLIKRIRLLASSGRNNFHTYLLQPLLYASWRRAHSSESISKIRQRIERQAEDHPHTVAPLGKRLIGQALNENPSAVGNTAIYFLEMGMRHPDVWSAAEMRELISIIQPPLEKFESILTRKSTEDFAQKLADMTPEQIEEAFRPVELGRGDELVRLNQQARILFEKIKRANQKNDTLACRKLIASYLIQYADQDENNRDQVEQLIDALEQRYGAFRKELHDFIAIELFYRISQGIAGSDLKKAIQAIKKYAFIFEGDPEALYHKDIDRLEKKLYSMIRGKGFDGPVDPIQRLLS